MPSFTKLWANHPNVKGENPLLDKRVYQNQCAINLYAALERSGVNFKAFRGQLSWQKDKPKYAIRAQELANWLASPFGKSGGVGMPEVQKFSGKEVFEKIRGKRGIIFFQNYYGPGNQGDHIDLWDGRDSHTGLRGFEFSFTYPVATGQITVKRSRCGSGHYHEAFSLYRCWSSARLRAWLYRRQSLCSLV